MKSEIIFYAVLSVFIVCYGDAIHLSVKNDGPVIVGSNIVFEGVLTGALDVPYVWVWEDGFSTVKQNANLRSQLVTSYRQPGNFTMTLTVKLFVFTVARNKTQFRISVTIPGELDVYQGNKSIPLNEYVSTANETYLYTKLYDPGGFLTNATIFYWWYIDGSLLENKSPNLTFGFNNSKDYNVIVFVNAYNYKQPLQWASFSRLIRARDPIRTINVTGNTLLKRGDLVDLTIECDGSSPWVYCWEAIDNGNATLDDVSCSNIVTTNDCEFRPIWYFEHTGHHKILINISNDINQRVRLLGINILSGIPEAQLSTVIIPIVGSLLAITIIVVGVLYFIQTRHRLTIEVADFDFTSTDSLTYRTFFEQLKDAIVDALPHTSCSLFERNWNFIDCCAETDSLSASNSTTDTKMDDSDDTGRRLPSPVQ